MWNSSSFALPLLGRTSLSVLSSNSNHFDSSHLLSIEIYKFLHNWVRHVWQASIEWQIEIFVHFNVRNWFIRSADVGRRPKVSLVRFTWAIFVSNLISIEIDWQMSMMDVRRPRNVNWFVGPSNKLALWPIECLLKYFRTKLISITNNPKIDFSSNRQMCKVELGHFLYLTIENVTFANGRIPQKWYDGRFAIYSLTFHRCDFSVIDKNAFAVTAFKLLKLLNFETVTVFSLESGRLTGIDELSELSFRNASLARIDDGFMHQIARYLYKFEMVSQEPRSSIRINDLIERTTLPLLWSFHLECAGINEPLLAEKHLAALTVVHTLKLIDCEIEAIAVTAFDRISGSLKILHLQRNRMKTLGENVFDKLLLHRITDIGLAGNPWMCDANVIALAEKLRKQNLQFDISQCNISISSLRPPSPTSSQQPVDGSTTTVLPPAPIVKCLNWIQKSKEFSIKLDRRTQHVIIKVFLRHQMNTFRLYVMFFARAIDIVEMQTCTKIKTQKCLSILTGSYAVIKLPVNMKELNVVHTICLLVESEQQTHPLHCISFAQTTASADLDQNTWIPMSAQIWLLPTLGVSYLFAIGFGASIAFGVFKMRPRLLRGNRRIVVLKDDKCRRSTVVVMPKEWNCNRWSLCHLHVCSWFHNLIISIPTGIYALHRRMPMWNSNQDQHHFRLHDHAAQCRR